MSTLVAIPIDRFSRDEAQIILCIPLAGSNTETCLPCSRTGPVKLLKRVLIV